MPNDSTTGGYLLPTSDSRAPLEGAALLTFIQNWIVGISGLPGNMVRPRWQTEPPNIPAEGNAWAAIGITERNPDLYPPMVHVCENATNGVGHDEQQQHEFIDILCSFYDRGVTGLADSYAAQTRAGMAVPQNREPLFKAGWGFTDAGPPRPAPSLLKLTWTYRVDLRVVLRRANVRVYPIRNVLTLNGTLQPSAGNVTLNLK